ncbi:hypothetical protein V9L05_11735 [Bernardetia sp. Wsw4-3y2]|uniref:hypothetical protein n=1 Tax=Bernardetia sp. Wsw4-3y2 TaxID=3127471 RepID=UPI0030D32E05
MEIVSKKESKLQKVDAIECRIDAPYPFDLRVQYAGTTFGSGKYDIYWDHNFLISHFDPMTATRISIVNYLEQEIYSLATPNDGYQRIELPYTGSVKVRVHFNCFCGGGCASYDEVDMYLFYMDGGSGSLQPQ